MSKESWEKIVLLIRLPRAITALLAGAALSVSGLLMQTFFRNPLAGPFVLGISSGASLGVAFAIMGAFSSQARCEGWSQQEIDLVLDHATTGNYDHLVATISMYCKPLNDFNDE